MSLNKILIGLIIALGVIVGLFLAYNHFFRESPSDRLQPTSQIKSNINALSQEPAHSPTIADNKAKYYSAANGYVYQTSLDGTKTTRLSSAILPDLLKVLWSPSKQKVISLFNDLGQTKKYYYDYETGQSVALDINIRWIDWSFDQDQIIYQYYNPQSDASAISIANPDASNWQVVFETRMQDLIVDWPAANVISLRTKPSGLAQSVAYTIDSKGDNLTKVIDNTYGMSALFSPLADKILFSQTNSQGKDLKLKIADLKDQTIQELGFVTLPEKCVWSRDNETLFCAVPKRISSTAVLPDDYYKGKVSFDDDFYQIDLKNKEIAEIKPDKDAVRNADNLLLSPLEDYLVFIDQQDGLLYSLKLD